MIRWQNIARNRPSKARNKFLSASKPSLDLCVLNLTRDYNKYTSNLDQAIAAVNYQIETHFAPEWGVSGHLINKTADFAIHVTRALDMAITNSGAIRFSQLLVDWIVNGHHDIDWSKTGIIYVTDPQADFGGVHLDKKVEDIDIPYALVGVSGPTWSVVLSHEVLELLADPWGTRFVQYHSDHEVTFQDQATGKTVKKSIPVQNWIVEVCDAIETDKDGYKISGVLVSDFVTKAYYDMKFTTNLDFNHLLKRTDPDRYPFPINPGGYLSFFDEADPNGLYQIVWPGNVSEPVYIKLDLGHAKNIQKLKELRGHHPSRLLKYWQSRKRYHASRLLHAVRGPEEPKEEPKEEVRSKL